MRAWEAEDGAAIDLPALLADAASVDGDIPLFDANDPRLSAPGDMPARIAAVLREAGEPVPATRAAFARTIVESIAQAFAGALAHRRAASPIARSTSSTSSAAARSTACSARRPPTARGFPCSPVRSRRRRSATCSCRRARTAGSDRMPRSRRSARRGRGLPAGAVRAAAPDDLWRHVRRGVRLGATARRLRAACRPPSLGDRDCRRHRRARRVRRDARAPGRRRRPLPAVLDHEAARRPDRRARDRARAAHPRDAARRRRSRSSAPAATTSCASGTSRATRPASSSRRSTPRRGSARRSSRRARLRRRHRLALLVGRVRGHRRDDRARAPARPGTPTSSTWAREIGADGLHAGRGIRPA